MIERTIFREEHEIFRQTVRRFVDREIVPFHAKWEEDGIVPRALWLKAGAAGLLCCTVPEEYAGWVSITCSTSSSSRSCAVRRERTGLSHPY